MLALPRSRRLSSASPDALGLGALGLRRPETLVPRHIPILHGGRGDHLRPVVGRMEPEVGAGVRLVGEERHS